VAVHLNPRNTDAIHDSGVTRHRQGDLDGALEDYDEAIRLEPNLGLVFLNRAKVRYSQGDVEGAMNDLAKAILFDSDLIGDGDMFFAVDGTEDPFGSHARWLM